MRRDRATAPSPHTHAKGLPSLTTDSVPQSLTCTSQRAMRARSFQAGLRRRGAAQRAWGGGECAQISAIAAGAPGQRGLRAGHSSRQHYQQHAWSHLQPGPHCGRALREFVRAGRAIYAPQGSPAQAGSRSLRTHGPGGQARARFCVRTWVGSCPPRRSPLAARLAGSPSFSSEERGTMVNIPKTKRAFCKG